MLPANDLVNPHVSRAPNIPESADHELVFIFKISIANSTINPDG
jgi:hypothetical protein